MKRGKFVVLDGIDGCGKSTLSTGVGNWLSCKTGKLSVLTQEPWKYREILLCGAEVKSELTEVLIFLADRREHSDEVILPALEAGKNVICERWNASTLAYQKVEAAAKLIELCELPEPDAEIYLEIRAEEALRRVLERGGAADKYEKRGLSYLREVSSRYRELAEARGMITVCCDGLTREEVLTETVSKLGVKLCQSR